MRPRLLSCSAIAGFLAWHPAFAEELPFPPLQEVICSDAHFVDKEKLAAYLLRKYPLSILALADTGAPADPKAKRLTLSHILAHRDVCDTKCGSGDKDILSDEIGALANFILGAYKESFDPIHKVGPAEYFMGSDQQPGIRCVLDANNRPVEAPRTAYTLPPKTSKSPVRIRGNPAHLYVRREDKANFSATDKAVFDVLGNHVSGATTSKYVGYLGYFIPIVEDKERGGHSEIIPYAGVSRNTVEVKEGSTVKPSASSTAQIGMLASAYIPSHASWGPFNHRINVRPDFLGDHRDASRIFSINIEYIPITAFVNDFIPIVPGVFSAKPMISLKANGGAYTERGIESVRDSHRNFFRAGGQAGIALTGNDAWEPWDYTATFTSLGAISGNTSIDYFKSSLTYSFDPNKYLGLTLSYSHGRREDTTKKENQWEIGISGRF